MRETQQKIIAALAATPEIDAGAEIERRVAFLVDYAAGIPRVRGFVLGISGGQDSVSYTHLDGYKRQASKCCRRQ